LAPDQPRLPPSPVVPRREHDVAVAREHDRVAELARENEALREYIREQASDRQAVIERYEHLLDQRDAREASRPAAAESASSSSASTPPTSGSSTPTAGGLLDSLRATAAAVRSRLAAWTGR
jgi:hypothetical protein